MADLNYLLDDPTVLPHLANMLAAVNSTKTPGDVIHLSNIVKQTHPNLHQKHQIKNMEISTPIWAHKKQ